MPFARRNFKKPAYSKRTFTPIKRARGLAAKRGKFRKSIAHLLWDNSRTVVINNHKQMEEKRRILVEKLHQAGRDYSYLSEAIGLTYYSNITTKYQLSNASEGHVSPSLLYDITSYFQLVRNEGVAPDISDEEYGVVETLRAQAVHHMNPLSGGGPTDVPVGESYIPMLVKLEAALYRSHRLKFNEMENLNRALYSESLVESVHAHMSGDDVKHISQTPKYQGYDHVLFGPFGPFDMQQLRTVNPSLNAVKGVLDEDAIGDVLDQHNVDAYKKIHAINQERVEQEADKWTQAGIYLDANAQNKYIMPAHVLEFHSRIGSRVAARSAFDVSKLSRRARMLAGQMQKRSAVLRDIKRVRGEKRKAAREKYDKIVAGIKPKQLKMLPHSEESERSLDPHSAFPDLVVHYSAPQDQFLGPEGISTALGGPGFDEAIAKIAKTGVLEVYDPIDAYAAQHDAMYALAALAPEEMAVDIVSDADQLMIDQLDYQLRYLENLGGRARAGLARKAVKIQKSIKEKTGVGLFQPKGVKKGEMASDRRFKKLQDLRKAKGLLPPKGVKQLEKFYSEALQMKRTKKSAESLGTAFAKDPVYTKKKKKKHRRGREEL